MIREDSATLTPTLSLAEGEGAISTPSPPERLSCLSSELLPWALVSQHRVENGEELAHRGGEGDFFRPARGRQALIEMEEHGIKADRGEGGHIQHAAHGGAPPGDHAAAAPLAALPVQRRH